MTPAWLGAVLTALGHVPPDPSGTLRYCDLGCGPGLGAVLTAAANPAIHVTAIDFDPAHVAQTRALAEAGGIGNIAVEPDDIGALAAGPADRFRPFDIIALHGVFSWITPATRRDVMALIDRWLAPGGLVYVHYMTHPGMASFAAGRMLLRRLAGSRAGDAGATVRAGLDLLHRLADAGGGYFIAHPEERQRLDNARDDDARYLVHEFLSAAWEPLHVAEVMEMFAGIGCGYVGSADPPENIDALSLPGDTAGVVAGIADPAVRETARDIARNQSLRRDIYRRGGETLSPAAHMRVLERLALARLPGAPRSGGLTFDTRIGPVEGAAQVFSPLLSALAAGPARFGDFSRRPPFAHAPSVLNQAFQMLMWSGCAHPLLAGAADAAPARRLNRHLAQQALAAGEARAWLAAPAIGSAIRIDAALLAAFLALTDASPATPSTAADAGCARLPVDADAGAWQATFRQDTLPVLRALGIVP